MRTQIPEIDGYLHSRRHAASPILFAAVLTALVLPVASQAQGYTITTVAGNGASKYAGDGGKATAASFSSPIGVAVDKNGNIFVADNADCVIREFVAGGTIATVAGKPAQGADTRAMARRPPSNCGRPAWRWTQPGTSTSPSPPTAASAS